MDRVDESVLPDDSAKPDGEASTVGGGFVLKDCMIDGDTSHGIRVGEPCCPVCGEPIRLDDLCTDNWPASSNLGPVHAKCSKQAEQEYTAWLDEQNTLAQAPLGE